MKKESFFSLLKTDLNGIENKTCRRITDAFYCENYINLRVSAVFVFICQIIFIVRDIAADFYSESYINYVNLFFEVLIGAYSLAFFIYASFKSPSWTNDRASRIIYKAYFLLITASICFFTFGDMYVRHKPFGICICFLFLPIIAPFFDMIRQTALFATVTVTSSIIYCFCFPEDITGVIGVIFLPLLLYVTSCFIRAYFIRILIYREKMRELTEELTYRNKTDYLTDASTRQCIYDDIENARNSQINIGIVIYDIDDFKMFNDEFSHITGDKCLRETCLAVRSFAENNNGKLYRYGDEEFVIIFFDISDESFVKLVPKINGVITNLKIAHAQRAGRPYISASVGGTFSSDHGETVESVLLRCDKALYEAKANGKDCYVIK